MILSVIVCTHNPRPEYLQRVLEAFKAQTLPREGWELLLIDNASREPVAGRFDLSWHPRGRVIREVELGLTPARLRGVREAAGEVLVFVDDDNVPAADYLEQVAAVAGEWAGVGVFGGSIKGEFEIPPPGWSVPYLPGLVIDELREDHRSRVAEWSKATPFGAGLCVRGEIAREYARRVGGDALRKALGRSGSGLGAGEDTDLAWTAIDLGWEMGRFARLRMTHLIPRERLTEDYMVRLYAGFAGANLVLGAVRGRWPEGSRWRRGCRFVVDYLKARGVERRMVVATFRAEWRARAALERSRREGVGVWGGGERRDGGG